MRVAVYAAPGTQTSDAVAVRLRLRAESWLGRSVSGLEVPRAAPAGIGREALDELTVDARRYGFHGTLKAPFRLAAGTSLAELDRAVARFTERRSAVVLPRLTLARLGGFFALVPGAPAARLHALADDVVAGFDRFRAPATRDETARRDPESLTERQQAFLAEYGYPYVLDEFRFHLTLTDRIAPGRRPEVEGLARDWFGDLLDQDVPIDALAVFVEPEPGAPFVLHAAHRLRPAPAHTPRAPMTGSARTHHEGTR